MQKQILLIARPALERILCPNSEGGPIMKNNLTSYLAIRRFLKVSREFLKILFLILELIQKLK